MTVDAQIRQQVMRQVQYIAYVFKYLEVEHVPISRSDLSSVISRSRQNPKNVLGALNSVNSVKENQWLM